ncbi:uncharacterized protein LOC100177023 isoform X2 [Ciona intestinalis]
MSKKVRVGSWSNEETMLLIDLIQEKNIIEKIDGRQGRNQQYYKVIAEEFAQRHLKKNWKQVSIKWKNLKAQYYNILKSESKSTAEAAEWPFFVKLNELLPCRPRTKAAKGKSITVDTMVQQWGLFTEQEGIGSQEFVDTESVNEAETSSATSTEEEAPPQPRSSGTKHKATKRKAERGGWSEFIDVYREECAKDRKSWEMMVQSMNDTFSRAINVLVSSLNPAVVLKMSPNAASSSNTE